MDAPNTRIPREANALPLRYGRPLAGSPTVHHGRKHPASATSAPIAARSLVRPTGRRCMVIPASGLAVDLGAQDAHESEVPVQLAVVEPVADDELVRNREAGVVDLDLHQAACGLVEQRADPERCRLLAAEVA